MVYKLIYDNLLEIFGTLGVQWFDVGVQIIAFVLTCGFVLLFLALPLYLLLRFIDLLGASGLVKEENRQKTKKKRFRL